MRSARELRNSFQNGSINREKAPVPERHGRFSSAADYYSAASHGRLANSAEGLSSRLRAADSAGWPAVFPHVRQTHSWRVHRMKAMQEIRRSGKKFHRSGVSSLGADDGAAEEHAAGRRKSLPAITRSDRGGERAGSRRFSERFQPPWPRTGKIYVLSVLRHVVHHGILPS